MNLIAYRPQRTLRTSVNDTYRPAVNVLETENEFRIELIVPGFSKENFDLQVENELLTLSATVEPTEREEETVIRRQFEARSFERRFELPDSVNPDTLGASYDNGILTVTLPKREEAKPQPPRKIEIA